MRRLTARLLLLLVVTGFSTPAVRAFSARPAHECCLRRSHAPGSGNRQIHDASGHDGNCCPPITTSQSACLAAALITASVAPAAEFVAGVHPFKRAGSINSGDSTRAPPVLF